MLEHRRSGDRRRDVRFEVLGDLWATLEVRPSLRLLNVSQGGVLVECLQPLAVDTAYRVRLDVGEASSIIPVTVRHVQPGSNGYRMGLEFAEALDETRLPLLGLAGDPGDGSPP